MRLPIIEPALGIRLDKPSVHALCAAMALGDGGWMKFYGWRLRSIFDQCRWRRMDRQSFGRSCHRRDVSSYSALFEAVDAGRGLLVAIPHFGCFVDSILAMARQLHGRCRVSVFYEDPGVHAGNARFDELAGRIFDDGTLEVLHNGPRGIRRAVKALREGCVVVLLPDVYGPGTPTYPVPFAGGLRQAAMGAAYLTRKTGALLLPVVSMPKPLGAFESRFGSQIDAREALPRNFGKFDEVVRDFRVTRDLFAALDQLMDAQYLYWQYASSHFGSQGRLHRFDATRFSAQIELCLQDPRLRVLKQKRP